MDEVCRAEAWGGIIAAYGRLITSWADKRRGRSVLRALVLMSLAICPAMLRTDY